MKVRSRKPARVKWISMMLLLMMFIICTTEALGENVASDKTIFAAEVFLNYEYLSMLSVGLPT